MSNTVFILGAGASKEAGVPLMNEFLGKAHDLWKSGKVQKVADSFQTIFEGISDLQLVHSKHPLDIQNVESVFAAFEMANTLQRFSNYKSAQIDMLVNAMRQVIVETVEKTFLISHIHANKNPYPPDSYLNFTQAINHITRFAIPKTNVAVITFNYDMALDYTLYKQNIPFNYSLGVNDTDGIPVLKLHGSVNWALCSKCNKIIPWFVSDYLKKFPFREVNKDYLHKPLEIGSRITSFSHCGTPITKEPVIVPPTWNKTEYSKNLKSVWRRAAEVLNDAENIFVIGYSLPDSDLFFKYLFALGTLGKTIIRRFCVIDKDESVADKFRELLGPGAKQGFRFVDGTFSEMIEQARIMLNA